MHTFRLENVIEIIVKEKIVITRAQWKNLFTIYFLFNFRLAFSLILNLLKPWLQVQNENHNTESPTPQW